VPLGFVHCLPHAPQLETAFRDASHPVVTLPSQSPKPGLQVIAHAPATHDGEPLTLLQTLLQEPQ